MRSFTRRFSLALRSSARVVRDDITFAATQLRARPVVALVGALTLALGVDSMSALRAE